jgi:hypothetical protein
LNNPDAHERLQPINHKHHDLERPAGNSSGGSSNMHTFINPAAYAASSPSITNTTVLNALQDIKESSNSDGSNMHSLHDLGKPMNAASWSNRKKPCLKALQDNPKVKQQQQHHVHL